MYRSTLEGLAAQAHAPVAAHSTSPQSSSPYPDRSRLVETGPTVQAKLVDQLDALQLQIEHERLRLEICTVAQGVLSVAIQANFSQASTEWRLAMRTSIDACIASLIRCRNAFT